MPYSAVLRRQAERVPRLCVRVGHSGVSFDDYPCDYCKADAAALRALAGLMGQAVELSGYLERADWPKEAAPRAFDLIAALAAGYRAAPEEGESQ